MHAISRLPRRSGQMTLGNSAEGAGALFFVATIPVDADAP